jgi:hypothetical protein
VDTKKKIIPDHSTQPLPSYPEEQKDRTSKEVTEDLKSCDRQTRQNFINFICDEIANLSIMHIINVSRENHWCHCKKIFFYIFIVQKKNQSQFNLRESYFC